MNATAILRTISSSLQYPVIIILFLLMAAVLILLGSLIAEGITERRHLKAHMPGLVDQIRNEKASTAETIQNSRLLNRQKGILVELTKHPELTENMREALALRLVTEEQSRYETIVKISDLMAKLGPIFGLLGTLIPLGPGIVALGQGDTYLLSESLLIAFDTTVVGMMVAAIAMIISAVRKSWYKNYMSVLETLTDCVLEVEKERDQG